MRWCENMIISNELRTFMTRNIMPEAKALGIKATVDFEKLSPRMLDRLDANRDGKIDEDEARAFLALADADGNGAVSWQELNDVDKMAGSEAESAGEAARLIASPYVHHAEGVTEAISKADSAAWTALLAARDARTAGMETARAALGNVPIPNKKAAALKAERATINVETEQKQKAAS